MPQWWESGFALVNLHLIMEVSNDWPKKKMRLVDLSQQLDTHWFLVDLPQ